MYRINSIWYEILEDPLIQYIPLNKETILIRQDISLIGTLGMRVKAINDPENFKRASIMFSFNKGIEREINWQSELPILTLNLIASELKYRTTKVIILGEEQSGYLELFTVNRKYFYRNHIYFLAYDALGRRLNIPTEVFPVD